jgi:riboflavin kinase/FMN adenylyltransferase
LRVVRGSAHLEEQLRGPVLTIGNFDGIHAGHRSILETVVRRAAVLQGEAAVYTFEPHPRKVLQSESAPGLLTTFEQKLELLEEAGVDLVVAEPFTLEFARTPSDVFVREVIFGRIRPQEVYVGYDFHFGRDRKGSMRQLTEMGPRLGFAVTIIPEVTFGGADVNSTRIRSLLTEGRVEDAATLLGRKYAVRGEVVVGEQRGRTLGFPTLNLALENEVWPRAGVYAGVVTFLDDGVPPRGVSFGAVANLGRRPTFGRDDALQVEAHLFEFDADAYGRRVELAFRSRLRDEQAFESVEALRTQIAADASRARHELGKP